MEKHTEILEPKRMNKLRIINFISSHGKTSKAEISNRLKLSMPTTLQNVKELTDAGIVVEEGAYESTGGRKAKALSISGTAGYAAGVDITNNHVFIALVNTKKEMIGGKRLQIPFENTPKYYETIKSCIDRMVNGCGVGREKVIGVGLSLPGIVDKEQKLLIRSHTLRVQNISFRSLDNLFGYECRLENDANSAAYAELMDTGRDAVYLSLSDTVGGAIYLQDRLYEGDHFKSAEFGHMIIRQGGKLCYCGKRGCLDAYCSAKLLQEHGGGSLELFFEKVRNRDAGVLPVWDMYLNDLAVGVSNLRMAFDCDIVLGGYVGGYMEDFMPEFTQKLQQYNNFDIDSSYLRTGKYKLEASAYGVTLGFIRSFLNSLA